MKVEDILAVTAISAACLMLAAALAYISQIGSSQIGSIYHNDDEEANCDFCDEPVAALVESDHYDCHICRQCARSIAARRDWPTAKPFSALRPPD